MAARAAQKKKPRAKPRKKAAPSTRGLGPRDVARGTSETEALGRDIEAAGGAVIGAYRDPLGGHGVVLASLPLDKVEPTPFQRDVSEPHVKRLANAMERVDRFLDPIIVVPKEGRYWTPNGNHRLHASKLMGARSIVALVIPEEEVAYQILALNTEKAHNLKERSLEVIRMYRDLAASRPKAVESDLMHFFEEPTFITLGAAYDERARIPAGAYNPFLKRLEGFLELPLSEALPVREERARRLLELDDEVSRVAAALKEKGFDSPYLKTFVVARINYLRFHKGEPPDFDDAMDRLLASARKFNVERVKKEDIGRVGGGGGGGEDEG